MIQRLDVLSSHYINKHYSTRYRYDMSVEEAAELARRSIYHATFRDGASGGVASGMFTLSYQNELIIICR